MIILDASTLILIVKAEVLDVFLGDLREEVGIPPAVYEECCGGSKTPGGLTISKAVNEGKLSIKNLRNTAVAAKLAEDFNMARGESEAIALALQEKAQLVGIDDRRGIQACKLLGLSFTTALAILVRSFQKGLITREDAEVRLSLLARYGRYKSSLIEDARRKLEIER